MKLAIYGNADVAAAVKELGLKPKEVLVPAENVAAVEGFTQDAKLKLKSFKIEWSVIEGDNVEVAVNKRGEKYNRFAARNRDNSVLEEATDLLLLGNDPNLQWIEKSVNWKNSREDAGIVVYRWPVKKELVNDVMDDEVPF